MISLTELIARTNRLYKRSQVQMVAQREEYTRPPTKVYVLQQEPVTNQVNSHNWATEDLRP
jgi:hypothetical protein